VCISVLLLFSLSLSDCVWFSVVCVFPCFCVSLSEKGTTEDEMVGWHHQFNGHEFEQTPGGG